VTGSLRLGAVVKVIGTAYWGGPHKDLTLGMPIATCMHVGLGDYVVCIRGQYLKGLLRRWSGRIESLLRTHGIIRSENLTIKLFGPSALEGRAKATALPSLVRVFDAYPVRDLPSAESLFRDGAFTYLSDSSGRVYRGVTDVFTRVRLCDVNGRASEGALFHEVRALHGTLMYFELAVAGLGPDELTDAARLLITSLAQLKYSSPGRACSLGDVRVVGLEPNWLRTDKLVEKLLRFVGEGGG